MLKARWSIALVLTASILLLVYLNGMRTSPPALEPRPVQAPAPAIVEPPRGHVLDGTPGSIERDVMVACACRAGREPCLVCRLGSDAEG